MASVTNLRAEWLEPDGLGGFASGTVSGTRTRRYHALLLAAATPPTGRVVLVNGFDAWVETPSGTFPITSQHYAPGVSSPDGAGRIESFDAEPWPRWTFRLEDGTVLEQELFVPKGRAACALSWRIAGRRVRAASGGPGGRRTAAPSVTLRVRPFFSGRDYHCLHHENPAFRFEPAAQAGGLVWHPYEGIPGIASLSNGSYTHEPAWYRNFLYEEERARGLDFTEDLASPGILSFDLAGGEAVWLLAAELPGAKELPARIPGEPAALVRRLRLDEKRRRAGFPARLDRAADAYIARRGRGSTIVAGYPWFTDWGRDTFISIRGLCIASGRLEEARRILVEWASAVSEGMLPNLFPDGASVPEYNSVDASLWYVVAVHELLGAMRSGRRRLPRPEEEALRGAVAAILEGYARGTRFGIRATGDGLLAAGVAGVQLTWMDAKVGDWVVTPRIGKPVEVQALWLNALRIGALIDPKWMDLYHAGLDSFRTRFWNQAGGFLFDVVDVDHEPGRVDASFRPNQVLAVGGLPFPLLEGEQARSVVDEVERRLLTPLGLRSLAPGGIGYAPRYEGGPARRDGSYHQGTVWPWLIGPFVEAWLRTRGVTVAAAREARARFLEPLLAHLDDAGLGHLPEIADAEPPHAPRGCPFQAWSVGEALRLDRLLAPSTGARRPAARAAKGRGGRAT